MLCCQEALCHHRPSTMSEARHHEPTQTSPPLSVSSWALVTVTVLASQVLSSLPTSSLPPVAQVHSAE